MYRVITLQASEKMTRLAGMRKILAIFILLGATACAANPYTEHYRANGTLHPELLAKHRTECIVLGFKDDTDALAECRKDLAQDWKYNLEENRRDRYNSPSFGIGYGFGSRSGGSFGVGSRW